MKYFSHLLIVPQSIEQREYQMNILRTALNRNTLCVLPTGLGKTQIAIMLAAERMGKYEGSKVLVVAPTRPLCAQHQRAFQEAMDIPKKEIILLTGKILPPARRAYYRNAKVITATPQTIMNDLRTGKLDLSNFSLLVVDECLVGNTKVKLADNNEVPIKKIVKEVNKGKTVWVTSFNERLKRFEPKRVLRGFKIPCKKDMIKIVGNGGEIIVTNDHLILCFTDEGTKWIPAKKITPGTEIASNLYEYDNQSCSRKCIVSNDNIVKTYSQERQRFAKIYIKSIRLRTKKGLSAAKIAKILNVSEHTVRNYINSPYQKPLPIRTVEKLNKNGLLPLTYNNPRLRILARVFGHMVGDGWFITKNKGPHLIGFSGAIDDLQRIKSDLKCLGVKFSSTYSRKTESTITNSKGEVIKVRGASNSFHCTDSSLTRLMFALKVPCGRRTDTPIKLPEWLMNAPIQIKAEFLAALMGSEGHVPGAIRNSRYFFVPRLSFSKLEGLKENGLSYARQLVRLFDDCGISAKINIKEGNIRKNGQRTIKFLITLGNSFENLLKFFGGIGFEYSRKKEELSNVMFKYLKFKRQHLRNRLELHNKVTTLWNQGLSGPQISDLTNINVGTVYSWTSGKRRPTFASPFLPTFETWVKKQFKKEHPPIKWSKVIKIENVKRVDYVYDISVEDNHNFLANGILVHNCHRSVKKYAYPFVSRIYEKAAAHPRILGLTASPGSSEQKIKEICRNLSISAVEIRSEKDRDVSPYVQKIDISTVRVELDEEMKKVQQRLRSVLKNRIEKLSKYTEHCRSKRDLLELQKKVSKKLQRERNPVYYFIVSHAAEAIKIWHALELLETQSISATKLYFDRVADGKSKATTRMLGDERIRDAILMVQYMNSQGKEHPKMEKLKEIIEQSIAANRDVKIIIFSQYRDNIDRIYRTLKEIDGCRPAVLIGQAKTNDKENTVSRGLKQKEQIEVIKDYEAYIYNVLITTSIGEEGLHLSSADMAIFYEPVPSEIRTIQRRGRVGRTKVGKVIFLLTKDTRDEGYYYAARRKERKMKEILTDMQEGMGQRNLEDF